MMVTVRVLVLRFACWSYDSRAGPTIRELVMWPMEKPVTSVMLQSEWFRGVTWSVSAATEMVASIPGCPSMAAPV